MKAKLRSCFVRVWTQREVSSKNVLEGEKGSRQVGKES